MTHNKYGHIGRRPQASSSAIKKSAQTFGQNHSNFLHVARNFLSVTSCTWLLAPSCTLQIAVPAMHNMQLGTHWYAFSLVIGTEAVRVFLLKFHLFSIFTSNILLFLLNCILFLIFLSFLFILSFFVPFLLVFFLFLKSFFFFFLLFRFFVVFFCLFFLLLFFKGLSYCEMFKIYFVLQVKNLTA